MPHVFPEEQPMEMIMPKRKQSVKPPPAPQPAWAVYLRTSSDENQKPELSRARQRFAIEENVLNRSDMPIYDEYIDILTGKTPKRDGYQRLLADARAGKFSHVIVERADRFGRNDTEALRAIDELNEFGVAVRFANSPDLDPIDPDDRVIVALSFTLARRESALLSIRVKGGLRAKRAKGGYLSKAPDGYINVNGATDRAQKKELGRIDHWIEIDPNRGAIWREAWQLLLTDEYTLAEIAEALHEKGYRHSTGRPFIEVKPNGKRKANISTLSNAFHNWTYAGWVVSDHHNIPPKTVRGQWEALVSTEDFERGLEILARRNARRIVRRKQEYLLTGLIYYEQPDGNLIRLTGSTSNAGRSGGGTAYYRIPKAGGVSFLCSDIDRMVAAQLGSIQVDPDLIPLIEAAYTHDLNTNIVGNRANERERLEAALKAVDDEENRTARLFASGKISEEVWDSLWAEWQDKRNKIRRTLETAKMDQQAHIDNLAVALQFIARIGALYNGLQRTDQKELLRQIVHRVVVNDRGCVSLELRTPFAYLHELSDEIKIVSMRRKARSAGKQSGGDYPAASSQKCSTLIQPCWGTWIRTKIDGSKVRCPTIGRFPKDRRIICEIA